MGGQDRTGQSLEENLLPAAPSPTRARTAAAECCNLRSMVCGQSGLSVLLAANYCAVYAIMHQSLFPDILEVEGDPFKQISYDESQGLGRNIGMLPSVGLVFIFAANSGFINAVLVHEFLFKKMDVCYAQVLNFIKKHPLHRSTPARRGMVALKLVVLASCVTASFYLNLPYFNKSFEALQFIGFRSLIWSSSTVFYVTRSVFMLTSVCKLVDEIFLHDSTQNSTRDSTQVTYTYRGLISAFVTALLYSMGTAAKFSSVEPVILNDIVVLLCGALLLAFNFYWCARFDIYDAINELNPGRNCAGVCSVILFLMMDIASCAPAVIVNYVGGQSNSSGDNLYTQTVKDLELPIDIFSAIAGAVMNLMAVVLCLKAVFAFLQKMLSKPKLLPCSWFSCSRPSCLFTEDDKNALKIDDQGIDGAASLEEASNTLLSAAFR